MSSRYLSITRTATPELLEILNNNVIGTPGQSMLYQHLGVNQKIELLADPYFVNLTRSGRIAGTCCFCNRATINTGNSIRSFYVRYFSFRDLFRRKSSRGKKITRKKGLRGEIESLLTGQGLDVKPGEKFYHYAYVDPRNERSAVLCKEFGFETVRTYTTIIFSRLNPKKKKLDRIVEASSVEAVKDLLGKFYQDYNMLSFENFSGRKYYFIQDDHGKTVAGVQASPDRWKIHTLPGLMGKLVLNLFSYLPVLNKMFGRDYRFITLEGIYVVPGNEPSLERLLESLLAQYQVRTAICVVDPESPLYAVMKSLRLGLMHALNKEVRGNVICRFVNFSEQEKDSFKAKPVYISGIDVT